MTDDHRLYIAEEICENPSNQRYLEVYQNRYPFPLLWGGGVPNGRGGR